MSLVDAIRQAATDELSKRREPEPFPFQSEAQVTGPTVEVVTVETENEKTTPEPTATTPETDCPPAGTLTANPSHGVVRLELMLSQEQLYELLRGLLSGVHSVFTTREAAHYLRLTATTVISMAEAGQLPGFLVEGKWRFSKASLDEWLVRQTQRGPDTTTNTEAKDAV